MSERQTLFGAVIATVLTVGTPAGVFAQGTGGQATIDEIIVTAQKRSQSIQD